MGKLPVGNAKQNLGKGMTCGTGPHDRTMAEGNKSDGIDRRTVLKGAGVSAIGLAGISGTATAHHPRDVQIDDCPESVVAGEEFTFDVTWQAGHPSYAEACFRAWVNDDGWELVGETTETGLSTGDTRTFEMTATVPETTERGTYTLRVNASEAYYRCPNPGECGYPILCDDCEIEVLPPVEVADVSFRGCGQVWVAFDDFPVDETDAEVNIGGTWESITISEDNLTTIPGQYGRDTPVYRHTVDGNGKLIGFRIVGDEYENDNRCAQNV